MSASRTPVATLDVECAQVQHVKLRSRSMCKDTSEGRHRHRFMFLERRTIRTGPIHRIAPRCSARRGSSTSVSSTSVPPHTSAASAYSFEGGAAPRATSRAVGARGAQFGLASGSDVERRVLAGGHAVFANATLHSFVCEYENALSTNKEQVRECEVRVSFHPLFASIRRVFHYKQKAKEAERAPRATRSVISPRVTLGRRNTPRGVLVKQGFQQRE
jgi:hypothetical protein